MKPKKTITADDWIDVLKMDTAEILTDEMMDRLFAKLFGKAASPSPSKKKRKKRKISLASGRKGRMKSSEKVKHKSG